MSYTTIGIVVAAAFLVSVILTWLEIPVLRRAGQNIREDGPQSHLSKAGTPSMGGIAIVIGTIIGCVAGFAYSADLAAAILVFVLFGLVGFLDDYLKVIKKNNLGLRAYQKFGLQMIISIAFAVYMAYFSGDGTSVWVPFVNVNVDFGIMYVPFIAFVLLAMTNAVNLTDGLDGLASGVTILVSLFFAIAAVTYNASAGGGVFCAALAGGCLGFLVFNKNPAKIFMGDTGSLALGGGLAAAAIVMHFELLLPIAGFVYVMEALSVIIQVVSFKTTGKRVFKMAPLHHHFELSGLKEKQVVGLFWGLALIFCLIGLVIL
ncbi:MAG: phospho-N-acetylmuramoyl-pentapeptide-transferase [Firmicutes bacterium]|nr:phospho-N-acetylmuramoyl-pentapeptide-transferase [Bacillota bacterium]